ncbi:GNAT family N-acetyltransferase [Dongia deserti]|uniref:GNAT family N-acetyltransferase n=1 Tax=Dongia deserti TaxID=2268030 RepID=UPI000E649086|nr:GNAT family N-acetyltransferase [Dongia deserti]
MNRPASTLSARVVDGVARIPAAAWDACAAGESALAGDCPENPFVGHAFLDALEQSGSVGRKAGWLPQHLVIEDGSGTLLAAAPLYVKSHSQGEYVFDHGWADAYERAGGRYYPKLQVAAPFTPVPGPRLLVRAGPRAKEARAALISALISAVENSGMSSLHVTFATREESDLLEQVGFLTRIGVQYHWANEGYAEFGDFLSALNSRKRKAIRKERAAVAEYGLAIHAYEGAELTAKHWDGFFAFYMDTGSRKWGRPYLNRDFFARIADSLRDRIVLMLAENDGQLVAGALNLKGPQALYGRNWGCLEDYRFLHFELCYYRAIDYAIAHKLSRVEAGAQGEHKIQRGYLPTDTYSSHWISDPRLRAAISDFLDRERAYMAQEKTALEEFTPYRHAERS